MISEELKQVAQEYTEKGNKCQEEMDAFIAGAEALIKMVWHKESDHPKNKHPYPVLNPDTGEMAFAYYYLGWHFDRDYAHSVNMLWLDIEQILPSKN